MKPSRNSRSRRNKETANAKLPTEWIKIRGRSFEVLERLSVPHRGRWKLRDPDPRPKGTLMTAIVVPDSAEVTQFRKSLARLPQSQHGLPRLITEDSQNGITTLVVSYCQGPTLSGYIKRFKKNGRWPISVWEAVRRMKGLAHSIATIHDHCLVIHGDIKPDNLILPSDAGTLVPIDFGSSWQIEKTASRKVGDGCNPFYSSPELFLGSKPVSDLSDQFSMGVVLFEMLTGGLPYEGYGGNAGHPGFESVRENYRPPSQLLGSDCQVPRKILKLLDEVVTKSLAVDPSCRYGSTKMFAQALGNVWLDLQSKADRHTSDSGFKKSIKSILSRWTA